MKYNIDWLIEEYEKKKRFKYIFFWGHQPTLNGSISKTCMSQWWVQPFEVDNINYPSAEHWMMAEKARLFKDDDILKKIIDCESAAEAKKLGRQVRGFDPDVWEAHRYDIVKAGNIHKFRQNKALQDYLLTTNTRILVEASPYDAIWGIGLAENVKNIENPSTWQGLNLLGFALMEVRDELATLA